MIGSDGDVDSDLLYALDWLVNRHMQLQIPPFLTGNEESIDHTSRSETRLPRSAIRGKGTEMTTFSNWIHWRPIFYANRGKKGPFESVESFISPFCSCCSFCSCCWSIYFVVCQKPVPLIKLPSLPLKSKPSSWAAAFHFLVGSLNEDKTRSLFLPLLFCPLFLDPPGGNNTYPRRSRE